MNRRRILEAALPTLLAAALLVSLVTVVFGRLTYPFDLEWMEGGMLAHAYWLQQGHPLYGPPSVDFVPYIYPPGYPALLAALGSVFGLSMPLGRIVSIVSISLAAAAISARIVRISGRPEIAFGSALVFLGTYPQSGAFYDLVRADSLGVALLAGAVLLGLERGRAAAVGAGLFLAASFLVKQSAAIYGLPMLLGIALRDRREALWFLASSALPALAATMLLQAYTGGGFLTWMLGVASAHPMAWGRLSVEIPREWGSAQPVAWGVLSVAALLGGIARQKSIPALPFSLVAVGLGFLWASVGLAPMQPARTLAQIAAGAGYVGMVALPASVGLSLLGWLLDRRDRAAVGLPWELVYEVAVLLTAIYSALAMRLHDSGFINVHTPLFLCMSVAFGSVLARSRGGMAAIAPLLLSAQLLWSLMPVLRQREALVPTAEDEAVGWRFVEAIRAAEGPVLSPFASWLPVYAGRPPSLHAMGVWDCDFPGGPYEGDLSVIRDAIAQRRWSLVLGGPHALLGDLSSGYRLSEVILTPDDPRFMPKTGYLTRPSRIWTPRGEK